MKKSLQNQPELTQFQIRNISILTHLYKNNAVTDEIVEILRQSELDYFGLVDKYRLLESKVNIDEKTSILKYKKDYLTSILKTASRVKYDNFNYHITLIRFDIDDFSIFNNKYGHDLGDEVLIKIARLLQDKSRPTDYVIRFGGEEFDIILPSTDINGGITYMEKMMKDIHTIRIPYNNEKLKVTLSAGMSQYIHTFKSSQIIDHHGIEDAYKKLQNEADDALYEAKYLGKDRYCIFSEEKKLKYIEMRKEYCK